MDILKKPLALVLSFVLFAQDLASAIPAGDLYFPGNNLLSAYQKALGISPQVAVVTAASGGGFGLRVSSSELGESKTLNPKLVVLIQDLHANQQAQEQIARVITQGYRQWGLRKVCVEGASSRVDVSVIRTLPKQAREDLVEDFLREGYLTGPEIAAVRLRNAWWNYGNLSPIQLWGVEDEGIYWKHVATHKKAKALEPRAIRELQQIRSLFQEDTVRNKNLSKIPSPLVGEGEGGGSVATAITPIPTFPHQGGRNFWRGSYTVIIV